MSDQVSAQLDASFRIFQVQRLLRPAVSGSKGQAQQLVSPRASGWLFTWLFACVLVYACVSRAGGGNREEESRHW